MNTNKDTLTSLRDKIDCIDEQLLKLLQQRCLLATQIKDIKIEIKPESPQIVDLTREKAIIKDLSEKNAVQASYLTSDDISTFWNILFIISKRIQGEKI